MNLTPFQARQYSNRAEKLTRLVCIDKMIREAWRRYSNAKEKAENINTFHPSWFEYRAMISKRAALRLETSFDNLLRELSMNITVNN